MSDLSPHEFAPGLWTFKHPLKLVGLNMGTRSTVWRLPSGGLAVHSPGAFTDEQYAAIDALGDVEILIAPSLMHYLFLERAGRHWKNARRLAAKGLQKKKPDLHIDETLEDHGNFGPDVTWLRVQGMPRLNEYVFIHHPSKTLIITDLCFHFDHHPQAAFRILQRINGAYGDLKVSRLLKAAIQNPTKTRQSIDEILAWDWDALTLAHGTPIPTGAKSRFQQAYSFLHP